MVSLRVYGLGFVFGGQGDLVCELIMRITEKNWKLLHYLEFRA